MAPQPWNLGPPKMDFSPIGNLGQSFQQGFDSSRKRRAEDEKRALLATVATGGDLSKLGLGLVATGDIQGGAALLSLGQKQKELLLSEQAAKNSPFAINRPTPTAPTVQGVAPLAALGTPSVTPRGVQVAETEADVQRLEAGMSGLTQAGDPNQPRGLRNNNPGNIEAGAFTQRQPGFEGSDGRFARFSSPEHGIQAADSLLQSYAGRGLNTVAGIVNRWAPPSENNTGSYVSQVARELGVDPNQPLDMSSPEVRQRLIAAKTRVENGQQPYGEEVYQRAYAGGAQPQPSQVAQAPQGAPAQDGLYTNTPTPALQAFINNPRVPDNLRTLMQQELATRQGGAPAAPAPVQMAQAPAQPGAPVSDVPVQGGAEVQGNFTIPGPNQLPPNDPRPDITTPQLLEVLANPRLAQQHPLAKFILDGRQKYSDENAPEKREQNRLATEKARLDIEKAKREASGLLTPEQEAQKIRLARAGRPINEPALPPGYRAVRDAEGNIERLEPIPGSKQAIEQEQLAEKKAKADILKAETGTVVGNALDDIDRLVSTATLPVTGAVGARVAGIPGTAAHDVSKALETIGANISFQQLQQMRDASPTGGALGNVTERELEMLKNSYAAISQSQSPEQFKTNLGRVRATFERIVHNRTLTPQERKTGGPMTLERAKGLREQAQQAIASGAPRDAVLKRLKDDYGITPEGL